MYNKRITPGQYMLSILFASACIVAALFLMSIVTVPLFIMLSPIAMTFVAIFGMMKILDA